MKKLSGITWQNPRGYNPLAASAKSYMEKHPGIEIIWEQQPWYQFENTILESLAKADGRYDIIMFDHPWTGKLAKENWLLPWDTLVSPAYIQDLKNRVVYPSTESYELDNHLWALPLDAACHTSLYRQDLINSSELPSTWEAIEAWAKDHHKPPHQYGLVLSVEGVLGNCLFLSMMAGLGYPACHDPNQPTCDKEAAEYVLSLLKCLLQYVPDGSTHWGPWDIYDHLCAANDVTYCPSIFAYVNYFQGVSAQGNQLRLGLVPRFETKETGRPILGGVGLGIAHSCLHIEEAVAYGRYLMSDDVQYDIFPTHDGQPATQNVWNDKAINNQFNNFYNDHHLNMKHAYIRPRYAGFHEVELQNGRVLQKWWDDEMSLHETVSLLMNSHI